MPDSSFHTGSRLTVVSGGQTGVDRAALDTAIALGISHGGWCPRGRLAEDGQIPPLYQLRETPTSAYSERTYQNVVDSDGTLILHSGILSGGTRLTSRLSSESGLPLTTVDLKAADAGVVAAVVSWLEAEHILVLNVAGPRESSHEGIYQSASRFLMRLFTYRG